MHLSIINGPNLNLLGQREPEIYGTEGFETYLKELKTQFPEATLDYYQSNIEGELIDKIQADGFNCDGIILNAGGYTHTSVALKDAIAAVDSPVIEVHISNVFAREEFRKESMIAASCIGGITGLGLEVYRLAVQYFKSQGEKSSR